MGTEWILKKGFWSRTSLFKFLMPCRQNTGSDESTEFIHIKYSEKCSTKYFLHVALKKSLRAVSCCFTLEYWETEGSRTRILDCCRISKMSIISNSTLKDRGLYFSLYVNYTSFFLASFWAVRSSNSSIIADACKINNFYIETKQFKNFASLFELKKKED